MFYRLQNRARSRSTRSRLQVAHKTPRSASSKLLCCCGEGVGVCVWQAARRFDDNFLRICFAPSDAPIQDAQHNQVKLVHQRNSWKAKSSTKSERYALLSCLSRLIYPQGRATGRSHSVDAGWDRHNYNGATNRSTLLPSSHS